MTSAEILELAQKLMTTLEEANASPADGNTALLYTLVMSMHVSRPALSPEAVANFLYGRILSLANEIKRQV